MDWRKVFKKQKDESGIALFMVIASLSLLIVLVTEFTYISQVNRKLAFDNLNSIKATYLAKSAFKISLLRIKAYQAVQKKIASIGKSTGQDVSAFVPTELIDKIWSFPLIYPLPTMGMNAIQRGGIEKFMEESELEGNFTALIESESSKINLNLFLASFQAKEPKKKKEDKDRGKKKKKKGEDGKKEEDDKKTSDNKDNQDDEEKKEDENPFDSKAARESLTKYFQQLYDNALETDEDFEDQYGDVNIEEFMDGIFSWADYEYEPQFGIPRDAIIATKRAPFYSVTELHMVPRMEDALYDLFAPNLTTSATVGVNVNTIQESVLRALFPNLSDEDVEEFFKNRDDPVEGKKFKTIDDFFKYLSDSTGLFRDQQDIDDFKKDLKRRNISLVTNESVFKITVTAQVQQSSKKLEAIVEWVEPEEKKKAGEQATDPAADPQTPAGTAPADPAAQTDPGAAAPGQAKAGLKVTFFRIM